MYTTIIVNTATHFSNRLELVGYDLTKSYLNYNTIPAYRVWPIIWLHPI